MQKSGDHNDLCYDVAGLVVRELKQQKVHEDNGGEKDESGYEPAK